MSNITSLSPTTQGIIPECFDTITRGMPIPFWDRYFQFLLDRLEQECPGLSRCDQVNRALGDMQLMACGDAAVVSLAASFLAFVILIAFSC